MDIAEDRAADLILHLLENRQPLIDADPARGSGRGAVRLVERGFVDEPHAGIASHAGKSFGAHQRMVQPLDLTRSGNQQQRALTTARHVGNIESRHFGVSRQRCCHSGVKPALIFPSKRRRSQ